jgi:anthranilate/para-aminobenzoate synthase component I
MGWALRGLKEDEYKGRARREVQALKAGGVDVDVEGELRRALAEMVRRRNIINAAGEDVSTFDTYLKAAMGNLELHQYDEVVANLNPCAEIINSAYETVINRGMVREQANELLLRAREDLSTVEKTPYTNPLSTQSDAKKDEIRLAVAKAQEHIQKGEYDEAVSLLQQSYGTIKAGEDKGDKER